METETKASRQEGASPKGRWALGKGNGYLEIAKNGQNKRRQFMNNHAEAVVNLSHSAEVLSFRDETYWFLTINPRKVKENNVIKAGSLAKTKP